MVSFQLVIRDSSSKEVRVKKMYASRVPNVEDYIRYGIHDIDRMVNRVVFIPSRNASDTLYARVIVNVHNNEALAELSSDNGWWTELTDL